VYHSYPYTQTHTQPSVDCSGLYIAQYHKIIQWFGLEGTL